MIDGSPLPPEEFWRDPPALWRDAPFWSWNAGLDPVRLRRQIESMKGAGIGGFFMHSRYGLRTPYLSEEWFACIAACIEKARAEGMAAYLYDEDRWPSGFAGGFITNDHPEFRLRFVQSVTTAPAAAEDVLGRFALVLSESGTLRSYRKLAKHEHVADGEQTRWYRVVEEPRAPVYNGGTYLDTMNPTAVSEFLRLTHEQYAKRFAGEFGRTVPALFTDEPHLGWPRQPDLANWTPSLPAAFRERRGYDILDHLPEIFHPSGDDPFSRVRHDYRRTLLELFVESYSRRIGSWCADHGIAFTGHYFEEATLNSQIRAIGAAMPHYEHMQWPGIDLLWDQCRELQTTKQCTSVADQLGKERTLSEVYGGTGWDWSLEGQKYVGDWQAACGINFRCLHLVHYSIAGGAKRDWPPSQFEHMPYWKYYRAVQDYFARLSLMIARGTPVRDVLVLHPVESGWGLFLPSGGRWEGGPCDELQEPLTRIIFSLTRGHYDWDFGDETILAHHGQVEDGTFVIGRMRYRLVVVPPSHTLRSTTVDLLLRFAQAGGTVLFCGHRPDLVDGSTGTEGLAQLIARSRTCEDGEGEPVATLERLLPRCVSIRENNSEAGFVWYLLRELTGGASLLFLQSHDRSSPDPWCAGIPGSDSDSSNRHAPSVKSWRFRSTCLPQARCS
jgi:hypothetical protein